ncbi:NUDIX domain-containing protein [Streptomyces sp. GbtcB6]|uniref:NUDIX domain-containing protein n=1 Tax=Streptomyces sp. GbtcB6 TaxID=2824751 RepID=UPI001C2F235D|nr:NUDIX domain-containing protein [Streptomyces sp. GbtcB6]
MVEPPRRITVDALPAHPDGCCPLHLRDTDKPLHNSGRWSLPDGRQVPGESPDEAIVRELQELTGLRIPDLVPFAFRAREWSGEPRVMEPDKCGGREWGPVEALPEPTVAYTRAAIDGIRHGRPCAETGWT